MFDAGQIAHVGFVVDGHFAIPMLYASPRRHGAAARQCRQSLLRHPASGAAVCLSVTHLDDWVLPRSHFKHSAKYRSVVVFGSAHTIDDPERTGNALLHRVDALLPGRAADSRPADPQELAGTRLVEGGDQRLQREVAERPTQGSSR